MKKLSPKEKVETEEEPPLKWKPAPGLTAVARTRSGTVHILHFIRPEYREHFLTAAKTQARKFRWGTGYAE